MPFNLDAVVAEVEADEAASDKPPYEFTFGGEDYTLPNSVDLRALSALSSGRMDAAFRILMGAEQWERMEAADARFTDKVFAALLESYMEHIGTKPGES